MINTYKAFLELIDSLGINTNHYRTGWFHGLEGYLFVSWKLGGQYKDYDDELILVDPEVEPDFEDLDILLEAIIPEVYTFDVLSYKALCRAVVERGADTDYKGGGQVFEGTKKVNLRKLYNYFREKGWVGGKKLKEV